MIAAEKKKGQFFVKARRAFRRPLVGLCLLGETDFSVYAYTNDALGRRTSKNNEQYGYNARGELVSATGNGNYSYQYDDIGNRRSSLERGVQSAEYVANNLNQYTSIEQLVLRSLGEGGSNNFTYDADGNLTNDGRNAYVYDGENRLVSVTPLNPQSGARAIENAYDHRSRRIRKVVKLFDGAAWQVAETHTFVWDGWNIVFEQIAFTGNTSSLVEYFWGNDISGTGQGAGGVGGLLATRIDGVLYLPVYDGNGNIMMYVNATGEVVAQYDYDPYGNILQATGSLASQFAFGFSTKYHDREVGLVAYQLRVYNPIHGRWLNRDTIGEAGGKNLYAFCMNRSLSLVDTLGLMPVNQWDSVYPESGRFSDALEDFLNGGGPKKYYYYYPDSATTRLLNHPEVNKIWQLFKSVDCSNGEAGFPINKSFSTKGNFMNFLTDIYTFFGTVNADRTLNLANLEARDFGYQVLGRFNVSYKISLDCSLCVRHLEMTITDAFTVTSLLRNPITMNPTITSPFLSSVKMTFSYDVKERVQ